MINPRSLFILFIPAHCTWPDRESLTPKLGLVRFRCRRAWRACEQENRRPKSLESAKMPAAKQPELAYLLEQLRPYAEIEGQLIFQHLEAQCKSYIIAQLTVSIVASFRKIGGAKQTWPLVSVGGAAARPCVDVQTDGSCFTLFSCIY